jgi:hypothetical protein
MTPSRETCPLNFLANRSGTPRSKGLFFTHNFNAITLKNTSDDAKLLRAVCVFWRIFS